MSLQTEAAGLALRVRKLRMRSNKHVGRRAKFAFTCAKCAEANELTVELGERRAWQAECHGCAALNEVKITVAEAANRLCAARGDPEWTAPPEDGEASDGAVEEAAAAAEPPKKRPKKAAPEEASTKPVVLKAGTAVIAKFHDGYYYTGIVEAMEAQTRFLIAWDDGDPASWVTARHTCLVYRQPLLSELQPGMPVLAQYSGTLRVEQGGVVLGRIEADNGFGESGLLSKRAKRSKTITCDSEECELVSIAAATFLRLTEKSSVLREMMQEDKDQRMAEWAAIRRQESSAGGEQPPASTGAEHAQLGEQSPGPAAAAGGAPRARTRS